MGLWGMVGVQGKCRQRGEGGGGEKGGGEGEGYDCAARASV